MTCLASGEAQGKAIVGPNRGWLPPIKREAKMSDKTKEAIVEIKADQSSLEIAFQQMIEEFEKNHRVVVVGVELERINVSMMGPEYESLLSRVLLMVAISPELAEERR